MDIPFFLRSIIIGFTLAAAVGPIWLLVMQRTLARGWLVGIASGLGVAFADSIFGLAGGLGFSALANSLEGSLIILKLLGAVVLIYLGVRIMSAKQDGHGNEGNQPQSINDKGLLRDFGSMVLLTFANPLTILSFAAIYTGIGADTLGLGLSTAWYFAGSIFVGSGIWWLLLVGILYQMKRVISPRVITWVNRISGFAIMVLGLRLFF